MSLLILYSGLIGRSWAMLFASAGMRVRLFDTQKTQVDSALQDIQEQLENLQQIGMLRGALAAQEQLALISGGDTVENCIKGAIHVQECIPENLELKKVVWSAIDSFVSIAKPNVTLASSTSCIVPSKFSEELQNRSRVFVAHPVNPPYYVPLVELVPAPWTDPDVMVRARALMERIGQSPVTLTKEMPGFALNRIQYAILNECWNLVNDGVLTVAEVDTVMTDGLGPRYAFMGPLETAHLNAEGMLNYCERYSKTIHDVSKTFSPVPEMSGPSAEAVHKQLSEKVPLEKLAERRQWRDKMLTALAKLKMQMRKKE
ncbi:hypothetical protein QYM36_010089 [Artemia franciscana]|uniref:Lambda-crystallin homolog n=1 Tax=Artemia franciscana TaxID=6661 RepID=A0AA88HZN7_ARTSF|nr:hypothetical protein QYM36_010089 [Artemia franciscana]